MSDSFRKIARSKFFSNKFLIFEQIPNFHSFEQTFKCWSNSDLFCSFEHMFHFWSRSNLFIISNKFLILDQILIFNSSNKFSRVYIQFLFSSPTFFFNFFFSASKSVSVGSRSWSCRRVAAAARWLGPTPGRRNTPGRFLFTLSPQLETNEWEREREREREREDVGVFQAERIIG